MRKTLLFALAGSACALTLPPAVRAAPPPPAPLVFSEGIEVQVTNVDVLVTDRDGRPVRGLRKGDFQLLEDGRAVDLSNFAEVGAGAATAPAAAGAADPASATDPASAPAPLRLVVYFDQRNIRTASRNRAAEQVREFVRSRLAPEDEVMVASYDLRLHVAQPFTADRRRVEAALERLETAPTYGDGSDRDRARALGAMLQDQALAKSATRRWGELTLENPCTPSIALPANDYAAAEREEVQRTARALNVLVDSLAGIPGRKALLYVSDGIPLTPGEELFQVLYELCGGDPSSGLGVAVDTAALDAADSYDGQRALLDAQRYHTAEIWNRVASHASGNRVAFYTLQARNPVDAVAGALAGSLGERFFQLPRISGTLSANFQNTLSLLAAETGGRAIFDAADFSSALDRLHDDFLHFYSLGYSPAAKGRAGARRLEVRVKGSGYRVSYQRAVASRSQVERAADRTLSGLFWNRDENPLGATIEGGEQTPGEGGAFSVPLRLRIPLFKMAIVNQGEQYSADLRLLVASRDAAGTVDSLRQVAVPIRIPNREVLKAFGQYYVYNLTLLLPPGERKVAVTIRDEVSTTTSYLTKTIEVGGAARPASAPR